ncbi:MAG: MFS transporter, partial [Anaerovorax sp.]
MKNTMKNGYYQYVGIYLGFYGAIGMVNPLLGQYLNSIGFTGTQVGIVTSVATAVGIFASPIWGSIYHRDGKTGGTRTVFILCIMAAAVSLCLIPIKACFLFVLLYGILGFFQMPVMPLADAMILESDHGFGAIRKWGAVGFAAGVLIAGQLAQLVGLKIIFPLYSVIFMITSIIIVCIMKSNKEIDGVYKEEKNQKPEKKAGKEEKEKWKEGGSDINYFLLLKNKKLMMLLMSAFFIGGTNVAHNTYFGFLYTQAGGSLAGMGVALLLMVGSEVPFMAWTERISEKFTLEKMIVIAMGISACRYFWYSTQPDYWMLIGTFFLQGMVNGIVLVELVKYIAKIVQPAAIGMAMTLYQAITSNCSTILCQFFGGILLDSYSASGVYLFFGIYNSIGICLYLAFGLYK